MKKIALLCLFLLSAVSIYAQEITGSVKGLATVQSAQFEIDFSNASIHGMSEEEFAEVEGDWFKDLPVIVGKFKSNAADALDGVLAFSSHSTTGYKVVISIVSVSAKGNYVCNATIYNRNVVEAEITGIRANGGHVGSALNLIKDGAEHTGKRFGAYLRKEIKRAK